MLKAHTQVKQYKHGKIKLPTKNRKTQGVEQQRP
jgi:hypothetical protein